MNVSSRAAETKALAVLAAVVLLAPVVFVSTGRGPWVMAIGQFSPAALVWCPAFVGILFVCLDLAGALPRVGDRMVRAMAHDALPLVVGAAAILLLPDRTLFIGDAMVRQGDFDLVTYSRIFPQATRLDALLLAGVRGSLGLPAGPFAQLLGLLGFALVWVGAVRLSRSSFDRVGARVSTLWIIVFGGYLVFCTGFPKVTPLMCGLGTLAIALAADARRSDLALVGVLIVSVASVFLHRSGLLLLPIGIFVALERLAWPAGRSRRLVIMAAIACLVPLVLILPATLRVLRDFDLTHNIHLRRGFPALDVVHVQHLANALVLLAPALLFLPALALLKGSDWARLRVPMIAGASSTLLFVCITPPQGAMRDWDVFALGGVFLTVFMALALGLVIQTLRPGRWITLAVVIAVTTPVLQWTWNAHDRTRGLERVEALAARRGLRDADRVHLLDFVGGSYFKMGDWNHAAPALRRAIRVAPHRRLFLMAALAETRRGNYSAAAEVYASMLARLGEDPIALVGLAGCSSALGDTTSARAVLNRLHALPGRRVVQGLRYLERYPEVWPVGDRELLDQLGEPRRNE